MVAAILPLPEDQSLPSGQAFTEGYSFIRPP